VALGEGERLDLGRARQGDPAAVVVGAGREPAVGEARRERLGLGGRQLLDRDDVGAQARGQAREALGIGGAGVQVGRDDAERGAQGGSSSPCIDTNGSPLNRRRQGSSGPESRLAVRAR